VDVGLDAAFDRGRNVLLRFSTSLGDRSALALGVVLGLMLASGGTAFATWFTTVVGEAEGTLASLAPLKVEIAPFDGVYPGQKASLVGVLENENPVKIAVGNIALAEFTSSEGDTCARGNFLPRAEGLVVEPGTTRDVLVGQLDIPDALDTRCQGAKLNLKLSITARFGS
jgi:hypothetical protein